MNLLESNDQDQYHQPNDEVQHFSSQQLCLLSPTITLIMTNTSSREGYDCGEVEPYKNDCLEKLAESNQSQNQQQQEPEQNVHKEQVQGNKLKQNYIQGRLNNVDMITTHGAKEVIYGLIAVSSDIGWCCLTPVRHIHSS